MVITDGHEVKSHSAGWGGVGAPPRPEPAGGPRKHMLLYENKARAFGVGNLAELVRKLFTGSQKCCKADCNAYP